MIQNFTTFINRIIAIAAVLCLVAQVSFAQVFWSESFDNGIPADWQVSNQTGSNFNWAETMVGPQGAFAIDSLHAPGSGETWIIYDSDLDCSGSQDALITSGVIDCSTQSSVWLGFDQVYRDFYDQTFVLVSTDNTNWDQVAVNVDEQPNDFGPTSLLVDLTSMAAGQSTVYIGFQFLSTPAEQPSNLAGCAYSWQIDNITLTADDPRPANDMRVNDNFYAISPNAVTPTTQIETFGFLADIENVGSETQTNVQLTIDIIDENSGNNVYTETLQYGDITSDSLAENSLFPNDGFTPSDDLTVYSGTYTVSSDQTELAENMDNNTQSFSFATSEDIFSKETGDQTSLLVVSPALDSWNAGDPLSWAWGNYFYIPNGDGYSAANISFAITNAAEVAGREVNVWLYKWVDDGDEVAQENERERVGFNIYPITGNEANTELITVDLINILDSSSEYVPLDDNAQYLAMIEFVSPNDQINLQLLGSEEYDYSAMVYRSQQLGTPRYAAFLGIGDNTNEYSSLGFGYDLVPVVRLGIEEITISVDELSDNNIINVFPNPSNNLVNLQVDLESSSSKMVVELMDVSGKALLTKEYSNVSANTYQLDVSTIASGTYMMSITTDAGTRTERVVVQH